MACGDENHYHGYSADEDAASRIKLLGYNEAADESTAQQRGRTKR
jgi:hypothetical protein